MGRGHGDRGRHRLAHGQRIRSVRGSPASPHRLALTYESRGVGPPVTVFAHGVASSIEEVRFLGSGVPGTKVFPALAGHDYPAVAAALRAVADEVGADGCVGVSMGAGALARILAQTPDRFSYAVFVLPASLDRPRPVLPVAPLPDDLLALRGVREQVAARARRMSRPDVAETLRGLAASVPVEDRGALRAVTARCLVIAHEGDEAHPVDVAYDLADALPDAALHVFDHPWSLLRDRAALRTLIVGWIASQPRP